MIEDVAFMLATRALALYRSREISPVQVMSETLRRLELYDRALNAFVLYAPEEAITQARASEARWQKGEPQRSSRRGSRRHQRHGVDARLAAVAGLVHHRPQPALGRGFTGDRAAAGGRHGVLRQDDDARIRLEAGHRLAAQRDHPQSVRPRMHPRRQQRG